MLLAFFFDFRRPWLRIDEFDGWEMVRTNAFCSFILWQKIFLGKDMFLNWFDTKEIELFAVSLGDEFRQRIALSIAGQPERERSRALDAAMHVILARVDKFISNGSANFYKKACFGNKLKWHLKDFGYPDAVVDQVVLAAVKRLSGLQTRRL